METEDSPSPPDNGDVVGQHRRTESADCSSASGSKSSPFHGFSSQDEGETENDREEENHFEEVVTPADTEKNTEVRSGPERMEGELKNQLIADFGIGRDVSEEDGDTENTESSEEPSGFEVEKKDSVLKNQIISDLGISSEVSEDDSESCETRAMEQGQEQDRDQEQEHEEVQEEEEFGTKEEREMETEISVAARDVAEENEENLAYENDGVSDNKDQEGDEIMCDKSDDDVSPLNIESKKISPLKIGQLKNSPKRVHFSPEVELREQSKEDFLIKTLDVTPKTSKKPSDTSPPLKLKIKFGKDKSGAITHCKINTKASEQEISPFDRDFHGFSDQEIPAWVVDNFEHLDLTSPFDIKPTIYVSISNKKEKQKQSVETEFVKSFSVAAVTPEIASVSIEQPQPSPSQPLSKRERRKKSDNLNFVKPLYDGWYREIVWRPVGDKRDAEVYYYPPNPAGQKKLRYKTTTELEAFLITSGSMYPISFFTFKKELVGGPPGWEVEREVEAPEKPLPTSTAAPLAETLGKRVSKPPEKLIMETERETETPTRTSKRTIKPPDKFDTDSYSPASKQPRLDTGESVKSSILTPVGQSKQSKPASVSDQQDKSSGTLKLKNFSKMNVKNQISGGGGRAEAEGDFLEMEDTDQTAAITPGMTITKVKKSGGGSNQGECRIVSLSTCQPAML